MHVSSRLLEEGNVDGAEEQKQRIEQLQRERRKVLEENNMAHKPRFFKYASLCMFVSMWILQSKQVLQCVVIFFNFHVTNLHVVREYLSVLCLNVRI